MKLMIKPKRKQQWNSQSPPGPTTPETVEGSQTGPDVIPYVSVIIITAIVCLSVVISVHLVVKKKKEMIEIIKKVDIAYIIG